MQIRRTFIALIALSGLALAACSSSSSSTAAKPPASASASAALQTALKSIGATSYNATVGQRGLTGVGAFDPAAKNAKIELQGPEEGTNVDIQALQIGANLYAKFDAGAALDAQVGIDPTKWMQVDQSKLTGPNSHPFDTASTDALDIGGLMAGVNTVQRTSATVLTGTVDLTKATGVNVPSSDDLSKAGAAAKTTPFTATVDSQGRLTKLKIDADGYDKDLTVDVGLSNFGSATPLSAPAAADVIPAPDALYQLLNA